MKEMNIWQLQEYAQKNGGFDSGRFLVFFEKGFLECQWLDAYFGFIRIVQPERDGFFTVEQFRQEFGDEQKYLPTVGYKEEED